VHRILHRHAPRVATIWCVGNPPLKNVAAYYPGDNGCDWVGVNFYSVPFYENNPHRPALLDSPLSLLDPIYKMFAARKPIAICEYGASHRPALDKILRNDFAISKMAAVYGALPRLYPRVKLIDWFDMNSMRHPTAGKTLNDYTLTDQSAVMQAYRSVTAAPYFLSRFQRLGDPNPPLPRPLLADSKFRDVVRLSVWTDFQQAGRKVLLSVGGRIIYASARPGAHEIGLDLTRFPIGRQSLLVAIYDARNRLVNSRQTSLVVTR
jgi:hypothetical protein